MKKLIFLLMLCFFASNVQSQSRDDWNQPLDSNFYNTYIKYAEFVFEGSIEEFKFEIGKDIFGNSTYYMIQEFVVHKVFKGKLIEKKVSVIQTLENELIYNSYKDSRENLLKIKNKTYLITCVTNNKTPLYKKFNYTLLKPLGMFQYLVAYDKINDNYSNEKWYSENGNDIGKFEVFLPFPYKGIKIQELYDYLGSYPDTKLKVSDGTVFKRMTDEEFYKLKGIPNPDSVYLDYLRTRKADSILLKNSKIFKIETKKEKRKRIRKIENNRMNNATLIYKFENEFYSCIGSNDYLEFDITINSSASVYLASAFVFLNYNSDLFGTAAYSYGDITITKGSSFNSNTYIIDTYDIETDDRIGIE